MGYYEANVGVRGLMSTLSMGGRLAMTSCFVVLSIIHARERDSDGKKRGGDEDERERERERGKKRKRKKKELRGS